MAALAGLMTLAALAAWGARAFARPPNPQSWTLEGSRLAVLAADGRLCWEKRFASINPHYHQETIDTATIADLDGDGRNEVLFALVPEEKHDQSSSMYCYRADGKVAWTKPFGVSKRFGSREFDAAFRARYLRPVRVKGRTRILAISNHYLWYPARVALLDPADGRTLEEYWHPGRIYFAATRDLDADGNDELAFAALNNPGQGLGHAALGILRLPLSDNPRPGLGGTAGEFPAATGGGEWAYRLFPLPEVNQALGFLPMPVRLTLDGQKRIVMQVPGPESAAVVYTFDYQLKLIETRFSDNFAALNERLFRQRLLDHPLKAEETARLSRAAEFPWAPDGNSEAVRRRVDGR